MIATAPRHRKTPTVRLALVGALALLAVGVGPALAHTNAAKTYGDKAVSATEDARTTNHVAKVSESHCLHNYAVAQAERMASSSTMFHQSLGQVIRGCHLTSAGENVAYGFPDGRTVVTKGWMRSAGHRENILNPDFSMVAIAARKDAHGVWYVSQVLGGR